MWEEDQRLLLSEVLDVLDRDLIPLSSLLCEFIEGTDVGFFGLGEPRDEQKIGIEITVFKGTDRCGVIG